MPEDVTTQWVSQPVRGNRSYRVWEPARVYATPYDLAKASPLTAARFGDNYRRLAGAGTVVSIMDNASPFIRQLALDFPKEARRAVRHAAWWIQRTLKQEMRVGAPGGQAVAPLSEVQKSRKLDRLKRGRGNRIQGAGKVFGALTQAVGYDGAKITDTHPTAAIGWLSRSAVKLGIRLQGGFVTQTWKDGAGSRRKVSYLFKKAGLRAPGKPEIVQPPRPVYDPFYRAHRDDIVRVLTDRLLLKINQGRAVSARAA